MLGLQAVRFHVAKTHLLELIGNEIEDAFPAGLGGVAAIAVALAELFQGVVQVTHRCLLGAAVRLNLQEGVRTLDLLRTLRSWPAVAFAAVAPFISIGQSSAGGRYSASGSGDGV